MKPATGPLATTIASGAISQRQLRLQEAEKKPTFAEDTRAITSLGDVMIGIAIALGIALTVLVYVIAPLVADAKASTDFSDGEKAMLGLVVLVVIGGIITATWASFKHRREGFRR